MDGAARTAAPAKPTLKTISRLAGVAVPTVSRALSDAPDIGADTKARVRRIAAEIGYVPNRAGVRLRTGRTNVIALVLSTEHAFMNHNSKLISAIAGGLRDTRFHLNMTPYFRGEDPMRPVRYIVETGSADAVILNQIEPEDARVAYLLDRGFPFATHGRTVWADRHPWFDYDNHAFGRIAVARMAERGRRNLLMVAPPMTQTYAQAMAEGARAVAAERGVRLRFLGKMTSDSPIDQVSDGVERMLAADPGIDGVISGSISGAMGVVAGVERRRLSVGADIDVFAKEAMRFLHLFRPGIVAIDEDVDRAGDFLARAAMAAVQSPGDPPMQELQVPE